MFDFLVLLAILCIMLMPLGCDGALRTTVFCPETERLALLRFKAGLLDPASRLSSWVGADCCSWTGVRCDNRTGHAVRLELRNPRPSNQPPVPSNWSLTGELNPSLLDLTHLTHLDLSRNFFQSTPIPGFIGSFKELRSLNLSSAGFIGAIPIQLGNLTALRRLDLSDAYGSALYVPDAMMLSGLTSLRQLDMSGVSFRQASDWLQALNMLPSLLQIRLSSCQLGGIPLNLQYVNFSSLVLLDLSRNNISSGVPNWLFKLGSLEYLDLDNNRFPGLVLEYIGNLTSLEVLILSGSFYFFDSGIPETLRNLCRLARLDLSWSRIRFKLNELGGALSGCISESLEDLDLRRTDLLGNFGDWLWDLKNLKRLDLSGNTIGGSMFVPELTKPSPLQELNLANTGLNGGVPEGIGSLVELVRLNLGHTSLEGVLSEAHFANLTRLEDLDISQSSLSLKFRSDWIAPFQLRIINMGSCRLGPRFPAWLRTQSRFSYLDLSNTGISDTMPDWFWNLSPRASYIDLSLNEISGKLPLSFKVTDYDYSVIDLSSNNFEGRLPSFPPKALAIDLSNNSISGPIPPRTGNGDPLIGLEYLSLSMNNIVGTIPLYLCRSKRLMAIDLSKNYLSGEIPGCLNSSSLQVLDFSDNNLTGGIPDTIFSQSSPQSLHLRNNSLSGELTSLLRRCRLRSCQLMATLDLSDNKLTGNIPTWLGDSIPNLNILSLRSNKLVGSIPQQLSHLRNLRVLDLSNNDLSGAIPREFGNFSAMMVNPRRRVIGAQVFFYYRENIMLTIKGRELEYDSYLASLVTIMDLSDNCLSGIIPEEIAHLSGLQSLNLSGNHLTREITVEIGRLRFLESLDLSRNHLSGEIPSSMSGLSFLTRLNLSNNNLSGSIPIGNQLQTLEDPSIYISNSDLCGPPLKVRCRGDQQTPQGPGAGDDRGDTAGIYASIGLGFAAGLWVVCGTLVFIERLRNHYFRFTDNVLDGLCDVWFRSPLAISWVLIFSVFFALVVFWSLMVGRTVHPRP